MTKPANDGLRHSTDDNVITRMTDVAMKTLLRCYENSTSMQQHGSRRREIKYQVSCSVITFTQLPTLLTPQAKTHVVLHECIQIQSHQCDLYSTAISVSCDIWASSEKARMPLKDQPYRWSSLIAHDVKTHLLVDVRERQKNRKVVITHTTRQYFQLTFANAAAVI